LKVTAIYEEIFENNQHAELSKKVLEQGDIGRTLINLAKEPFYKHESGRPIRHGYMSTVIKLSNLI
jgi:hypothetical protein